MRRIEAKQAKYIKLGGGGAWAPLCLSDGTLRLGYDYVPHETALKEDRDALRQVFLDRGDAPRTASSHAVQVFDFYHADPETIWITLADGFLWWCKAAPGVEYLDAEDHDGERFGSRIRRSVDGWQNRSVGGQPLRISELNGRLTKTAGFQGTICNVEAFDYLLRKVNDEELPEIQSAKSAQTVLLDCIEPLIKMLTWRDFETLAELIFAESGWRRTGTTGGTQETVDIELMLPSTRERAFVQVKSKTNQAQLNDYVDRLSRRDEDRMFYLYHSGPAALNCNDPRVSIIGPRQLAEMVLTAGLFDWVLDKAG